MKTKFSRILGVGLSLVMVMILAVALTPAVMADVTSADVSVSPSTTNDAAKYTLTLDTSKTLYGLTTALAVDNATAAALAVAAGTCLTSFNATQTIKFLDEDGLAADTTVYVDGTSTAVVAATGLTVATTKDYIFTEVGSIYTTGANMTASKAGTIYVEFPNDTTVPATYTADVAVAGDLGAITDGGFIVGGFTPTIVPMSTERAVTLVLPSTTNVKSTALIVTFYVAGTGEVGISNPSLARSYNLYANTSAETSLIKSASYTITLSLVKVNLYDSSGNKIGSPASIAALYHWLKPGM